jgi:hypothetical protein
MSRIVLFGGALAMLIAAGATTLAFETINPQRAAPAGAINPAPLSKPWQDKRQEMALP